MNQKISIAEATQAQFREFANNSLGLNLPPNTKDETVVAKITAAWGKDYIMVSKEEDIQKHAGAAPRPVTDVQASPEDDKVRIVISITEDPGGNEPVPVSVNGKAMLIPRGKEVDIPLSYFEVLNNAIAYKYESLGDGGLNPIPREVPAYPFQRVA